VGGGWQSAKLTKCRDLSGVGGGSIEMTGIHTTAQRGICGSRGRNRLWHHETGSGVIETSQPHTPPREYVRDIYIGVWGLPRRGEEAGPTTTKILTPRVIMRGKTFRPIGGSYDREMGGYTIKEEEEKRDTTQDSRRVVLSGTVLTQNTLRDKNRVQGKGRAKGHSRSSSRPPSQNEQFA